MAAGHSIAVIGAGSLRCGGKVLASLFNFEWPYGSQLYLCDQHQEALDLFDRLARSFAATQDTGMIIQATEDPVEALLDAQMVLLCFGLGEDGKQMLAKCVGSLSGKEAARARRLTRGVLLHHTFERVNELLFKMDPPANVIINLVAPVEVSAQLLATDAIHLEWPPPLEESERVPAAHHALRIVRGEDLPMLELQKHADSPLLGALLDHRPPPENKFNPGAVAAWLEELEKLVPGCKEVLMARR